MTNDPLSASAITRQLEMHDDDVFTRVHHRSAVTHSPTAASNEVE